MTGDDSQHFKLRTVIYTAIVTALVTGAMGLGFSFVQGRVASSTPRLTYFLSESIPFDDGNERRSIFVLRVENPGTSPVEDTQIEMATAPWTVEKSFVKASPALHPKSTVTATSPEVQISTQTLNPSEYVEATFVLVLAKGANPASIPLVAVRGKGVVAEQIKKSEGAGKLTISNAVGPFTVMVIASTLMAMWMMERVERRTRGGTASSDEKRRELLSLACIFDARPEMEYYGIHTQAVSYVSESDRLSRLIINESTTQFAGPRKEMLLALSKLDSVAAESMAVIHCNLAKVSLVIDHNPSEAKRWIESALKASKRDARERISIDNLLADFRK